MERMLVTKIVLNRDGNVELFARGHKFRDTLLFDPSDLQEVGIDPNELEVGQEVAVRFWALYELSQRLSKAGHAYKDIVALEPTDKPATSTSVDQSAVLEELRAILSVLQQLVNGGRLAQEPQEEGSAESARDPAPAEAPNGSPRSYPSLDDGQAKREFYRLAGPAVKEEKIAPTEVNELAKAGMATGWLDALRRLDAVVQGAAQ